MQNNNFSQYQPPYPNSQPTNFNPNEYKNCQNCGVMMHKSAKFCPRCGAKTQKSISGCGLAAIIVIVVAIIAIIFLVIPMTIILSNSSDSDSDVSSVQETSGTESKADDIWATSFTPINDFRYTLDKEDKTITLERYIGDDTKILLSPIYTINGVDYKLISMGDNACFLSEISITSVYIPEGVTYIGSSCFNSCSALKNLYIPVSAKIDDGFLDYIHEYDMHYDYVIDNAKKRDTTDYAETDNSVDQNEEIGEDLGRAFNGMMAGATEDSVVVNIYYGGNEEQWTSAIGDSTENPNNSEKSSSTEEAKDKSEVAGVGGTVETDNMKITLTHATIYSEIDGDLFKDVPADGKEFLVLFLEAENVSDIDNTIYPSNIEAYVDDVSVDSCVMFNDPEDCDMFYGDLASGKKLIGYVAYEVPTNWQKFEFFYEDSYIIASDKYSFEINKSDFN